MRLLIFVLTCPVGPCLDLDRSRHDYINAAWRSHCYMKCVRLNCLSSGFLPPTTGSDGHDWGFIIVVPHSCHRLAAFNRSTILFQPNARNVDPAEPEANWMRTNTTMPLNPYMTVKRLRAAYKSGMNARTELSILHSNASDSFLESSKACASHVPTSLLYHQRMRNAPIRIHTTAVTSSPCISPCALQFSSRSTKLANPCGQMLDFAAFILCRSERSVIVVESC